MVEGGTQDEGMTRSERRRLAVEELLSSEKTFVSEMTILEQTYMEPLNLWASELEDQSQEKKEDVDNNLTGASLSSSKLDLTPEDLRIVFTNLSGIAALNKQFLNDLQKAHSSSNGGDDILSAMLSVFLNYAPLFSLYSDYVNQFDKSREKLQELRDRPVVDAFIRACEMQTSCHGLRFADFLIQPVQRVPRFRLLLESILKYTPEGDPLHKQIKMCLDRISSVATKINDAVHTREARDKIVELQEDFNDSFLAPSRVFIKEGFLVKVSRNGPRTHKFLLFNDLLVYGDAKGLSRAGLGLLGKGKYRPQYKTSRKIFLDCLYVVAPPGHVSAFGGKKTPAAQLHDLLGDSGLMIITSSKSFILNAADPAEKDSWVNAIRDAMIALSVKDLKNNQARYGEVASSVSRRVIPQGAEFGVWSQGKDGKIGRQTFRLTDSALEKRFGVTGANDLIWGGSSSAMDGNDVPDDMSASGITTQLTNSILSPRTRLAMTRKETFKSQDITEGHSGLLGDSKKLEVEIRIRSGNMYTEKLGLRLSDMETGGVIVTSYSVPGGLGEVSGVKVGDIITHVNNAKVVIGRQIVEQLAECVHFNTFLYLVISRNLDFLAVRSVPLAAPREVIDGENDNPNEQSLKDMLKGIPPPPPPPTETAPMYSPPPPPTPEMPTVKPPLPPRFPK